jgi:DNA-directed RNA polymerase I subunit RPA12
MTWPFCPQCGTILDPPVRDDISCDFCRYTCPFNQISTGEIITHSGMRSKPAWVGEDEEEEEEEMLMAGSSLKTLSQQTKSATKKKGSKHATIEEPCPKCSHPEMYFYTMQLRSVDEGSTVFYECPKCSHKFSVNN